MKELPFKVTTTRLGYGAEEWCKEYIGERWNAVDCRSGVWTCFWAGRENPKWYHWYFEREQDANWFALKWI